MSTEPEKDYAPWSDEEVIAIRAWQDAHPAEALMCLLSSHFAPPTWPLVATIEAMQCPEEGCGGSQDWVYAYMLEGAPGS